MNKLNVTLEALKEYDREAFILDNQEAFKYGAMEEFGCRDNHYEEDGEIIARATIEQSIDSGMAFRILCDGRIVGGAVLQIKGEKGELELLFIKPSEHTKGIGQSAWNKIEEMFPEVKIWETVTPYFEKRNIHFYVNKCGFHIVEFFNRFHVDPHDPEMQEAQLSLADADEMDGMFRFEKYMGEKRK